MRKEGRGEGRTEDGRSEGRKDRRKGKRGNRRKREKSIIEGSFLSRFVKLTSSKSRQRRGSRSKKHKEENPGRS